MKDSLRFSIQRNFPVVNCFQKLLSSWWRTAKDVYMNKLNKLWIAFKNYYLRDEGQLGRCDHSFNSCCELLSKIIIFVMKDSLKNIALEAIEVVNCFQKLLSSWWRTANYSEQLAKGRLWIAFKNYYLRDEGQLFKRKCSCLYGCELLSKIIIFVMKDSHTKSKRKDWCVVNCFQKLLSSWWRTACFINPIAVHKLWIAFKNYYLRDEGQL